MPDSGSPQPHTREQASVTGSWQPSAGAPGRSSEAAPTVRTGSGSGLASGGSATNRQAMPALPLPGPGDRLDSFELQEAIGVGGMGAVFRALDLRLDRYVALKVLPPEQATDPENVQRFFSRHSLDSLQCSAFDGRQ